MIDPALFQIVQLLLSFCVVPLVIVLWNLKGEISTLRVSIAGLGEKFVTKDELKDTKGEMRDALQVVISSRNGHAQPHWKG